MENTQIQIPSSQIAPHVHWGHFGIILGTMTLLLGMTWLSKPQLFSFNKPQTVAYADVPHYYPYVPPPEDLPKPEVLGASTDQGPSIINEDGSVTPVDSMGQVLGANTNDPSLSLDSITVATVPDSDAAIKKYLSQDQAIEVTPVDGGAFEDALSSGNSNVMNQQAAKMSLVLNALQKLTVPEGFIQLDKLKIIEYTSAIAVLQDYSQLNQNPELVGQALEEFLQSQQNLSTEISAVAQKYNLDPNSIGPAGEAAVLTGAVQGASQGAQQAAATLAEQASSTSVSSLGAGQLPSGDGASGGGFNNNDN